MRAIKTTHRKKLLFVKRILRRALFDTALDEICRDNYIEGKGLTESELRSYYRKNKKLHLAYNIIVEFLFNDEVN